MAFTATDVKTLREKTGVGMMECKKALTEADGDFDRAVDILRERGLAAATKKASRITAEGVVLAHYDPEKSIAVLVEVNAETDFVGKNESFRAFVREVSETIAAQNPADVAALSACALPGGGTIEEARQEKVLTIGENITIRRFVRGEGVFSSYVHGGGTIGVLVQFDADPVAAQSNLFREAAKNIAMQVAAMNPVYLDKTSVPADVVEKELAIAKAQLAEDPKMVGKPEKVLEGAAQGRLGKFFKEVVLTEQAYFKDEKVNIGQYLQAVSKELGTELKATAFWRFVKGENIEKKADDFAAEIAKLSGN
jgi:elongation factor Ts